MTIDTAHLIARCMALEADNVRLQAENASLRLQRSEWGEDRLGQQLGHSVERRDARALAKRLRATASGLYWALMLSEAALHRTLHAYKPISDVAPPAGEGA